MSKNQSSLDQWATAVKSGRYVEESTPEDGTATSETEDTNSEGKTGLGSTEDKGSGASGKTITKSSSKGGTSWVQWVTLGLNVVGFPLIVFLLLSQPKESGQRALASVTTKLEKPIQIIKEVSIGASAKQLASVYQDLRAEILKSQKAIMTSLWKARQDIKVRGNNAQLAIEAFYQHYAKVKPDARLELVINRRKIPPPIGD